MPCCQLFAAGSDTYTSYGYCETITPDSGYQMAEGSLTYSLAVAGGETVKITGNRFTMPAGNVTITCKWETATTTAKGITSFSISGVVGAVNNTTNTITITLPRGTDVTKLTPVIATNGVKSLTPGSGETVDFTNAVTYTAAMEDGSSKTYMLRQGGVSYRVVSFSGGQAKNAIPAFGTATIVLSATEEDRAKAIIETFRAEFVEAFGNIESDMVFTTTFGDTAPDRVLTGEVGYGMVGLMTTVPNNVHTMSPFIDGLVESSANLGVVSVDEDMVRFTVFARSSVAYQATQIGVICSALANSFGFTFDSEGHVPGWAVNPNSKLTHIAYEAYKHLTGTDMIVEPVHAGVECGAFAEKNPHLDMISVGPTLLDVHTPNETCKIEDVKITTELLIEILERIAK